MTTYYEGINGGALPLDSPIYVWREADDRLYESLQNSNNHVCCVLAARQMGKTSLMVRTSKRLTDEGVICLQINLQKFGQISDENSFYHTLLDLICKRIKSYDPQILQTLRKFWDSQSSAMSRAVLFQDFMTTEILPKINNQQFVIFLDEIQTLINWGIHNSFLGFLRAMFDGSVSDSPLQNLKFVLLGVISPSDLLTCGDVAFNQREEIELGYFNRDIEFPMTHPLIKGLEKKSKSPQKLLEEIISWTRGQPFLTQWLCHLVEQNWTKTTEKELKISVEELVKTEIIDNWKQQRRDSQDHFQSIERWFTVSYAKSKEKMSALICYLELWNSQQPRDFDSNKKEHINLIVSGLVQKTNVTIDVANPIYREVFDLQWVQQIQQQEDNPMTEQRDYTLIIDRSPSMNIVDNPSDDSLSRWKIMQEVIVDYASKMTKKNPNGITIHLFSGIYESFYNQKADKVKKLFQDYSPGGFGTKLAKVLKQALDDYFERREKGQLKPDGEWILVVTDGEPNNEQKVLDLIVETSHKLNDRSELGLTFLRVGNDPGAKAFLTRLDDLLVKEHGAKLDFCDAKPLEALEQLNFDDLERDAFTD